MSSIYPHDALAPGTHEIVVDGVTQRYHVAGAGPVCVVHSGGPGIAWEYMRMPRVEAALTTVYVEPVGTGESGRLPDHPRTYHLLAFDPYQYGGTPEGLQSQSAKIRCKWQHSKV